MSNNRNTNGTRTDAGTIALLVNCQNAFANNLARLGREDADSIQGLVVQYHQLRGRLLSDPRAVVQEMYLGIISCADSCAETRVRRAPRYLSNILPPLDILSVLCMASQPCTTTRCTVQ